MNDHTPTPEQLHDSELTAYALGELAPGSERYAAVQARLAEDESARAYVEQARAMADELARQYAQVSVAGEGLAQDQREAVLAAVQTQAADQPAVAGVIRPAVHARPRFSRKALLAAGLALAAGAAITSAVLLNPNNPADPSQATVTDTPAAPTGPLEVIDRLNAPIDSDYSATPLRDALATLQQQTHTPIDIDWDALHQRGIDPDTPISFKADDAPAAAVLAMILQQAWRQSPHPDPVVWTLAEAGIRVEPRSSAVERMLTASRDAIAASNPRITASRAELFDLTPTLADVLPEIFVIELTPSQPSEPLTVENKDQYIRQYLADRGIDDATPDQVAAAHLQMCELRVQTAEQAVKNKNLPLASELYKEAVVLAPTHELHAQYSQRMLDIDKAAQQIDPATLAGQERQMEVNRRIRIARDLQKDRDYHLALAHVDAALAVNPQSEAAQALTLLFEDLIIGHEGDRLHRQLDLMRAGQVVLTTDVSAPYDRRLATITDRPELNPVAEEQAAGVSSDAGVFGAIQLPAQNFSINLNTSSYYANGVAVDPNASVALGLDTQLAGNRYFYYDSKASEGQAIQLGSELRLGYTERPDFTQAPTFSLNGALTNTISGGTGGGQGGGLFGDDESGAREAEEFFEHAAQVNRGRPLALPDIEGLNPADLRLPDPVTPGDVYAIVIDNPFHMVFEQPLSTFSVDVDTAGYSIVRRQLLQYGSLPQPEHVRIEEMINYFDYTYQAPQIDAELLDNGVVTQQVIDQLAGADPGFAPFATHTEVTDCPWAEGHKLVRVGIKGMEIAMEDRPQSHLTFLIDVSGSMNSPDKLGLVQQSLKLLLDQLNPDDKVSIVVYAGASGLVLEPTAVADRNKIVEAIDNLRAGGSTAGAEGIQLAYKVAQENFVDGGVNRVILCTDGDFNVGISDTDDLVALVKDKANPAADDDGVKRGVYLSAMGFGMGNLNDQMMELITNAGNGNYAYIDSLQEATKVMYDQAGATLVTIAKDVKIQVDFDPAQVLSYRLIGYENRILKAEDFENDQVDAGDIGAGHTVTALYEVVPFDANWQDNNDGPAVHNRVKQLKDALAMNATLLQTTRLTEEQQLKLSAATALLQQELKQATALSQRLALNAPGNGNAVKRAPERVGEPEPMLVVNLRYKPVDAPAEDGTSRLIEHPVQPEAVAFDQASEDMRFAASVAGLGMALRKSPHFAGGSYGWIIDTAKASVTHDPHGYRAQFITLAEKARELSGDVASEPVGDGK